MRPLLNIKKTSRSVTKSIKKLTQDDEQGLKARVQAEEEEEIKALKAVRFDEVSQDERKVESLDLLPRMSSRAQAWQSDAGCHFSGLLDFLNDPVSFSP